MAQDIEDAPEELTDQQQARAARKRSRELQLEEDMMLQAIMDLPLGRQWMWNLLERCNLFGHVFGENVQMTYFAGGEQNVAKRIFADIVRVCPNRYLEMIKERQNVERS